LHLRLVGERAIESSLLPEHWARPVRFAVVGGISGLAQLATLALLINSSVDPLVANAFGFAISAELNFLLSQTFTWRDRTRHDARDTMAARWLTFHMCIAGTAALNMAVFAVMRNEVPDLLAATIGILAAAVLNFLANDRVTFRPTIRRS